MTPSRSRFSGAGEKHTHTHKGGPRTNTNTCTKHLFTTHTHFTAVQATPQAVKSLSVISQMLTSLPHLVRRPALASLSSRTLPATLMMEPALAMVDPVAASSTTLAFADQAGNLAGASSPPRSRLTCSSSTSFARTSMASRRRRRQELHSLLGFVIAPVATSIISVKSYGLPLANCDWLHSGAEQLLSFTNIADVIGLKLTFDAFAASASQGGPGTPAPSSGAIPVLAAIGGVATLTCIATWLAAGGDLAAHTAYLGGVGNLPDGLWTLGFFDEPANALSLPRGSFTSPRFSSGSSRWALCGASAPSLATRAGRGSPGR